MLNDRAANYCQFYVAWIMRIAGVCVAMALWVSLAAAQTGADSAADAAKNLEQGFISPPQSAGLRAYWWWLNGNVTKDAITRDLEQMKAKGMAGGVIFDAGGATQGGHKAVPAGPVFASPEWRELFKHTVKEADRLGLTLSLSIQSGWNLGGPNVKPEDSAKRYSWSETQVKGPAKLDQVIAEPKQKNSGYYRDIAVVAYRLEGAAKQQAESNFSGITASSSQSSSSPDAAMDGNAETCWVSNGTAPGDGPTAKRPQWLQLSYKNPVAASSLSVLGRTGYGPRECELQASDDGKTFRKIKPFSMENSKQAKVAFEETKAACFRLVILDSYDPKEPKTPRNVQVAEFSLGGKEPIPSSRSGGRKPIQRFDEKTLSREIGGSAPDCSFLLDDFPGAPGEEDCRSKDVVDLTDRMDASGRLKWDAPEGAWMILRFGYSPSGSKVSTSSPGWAGMAIDYLDSQALINYWKEVVAPLIEDAGPLAGKSLKYLHTDSWELGGVNWTPKLPEMFRKRRGYDMRSYLPALAGKIVDNRAITNRFLHDFRKTVGDCVADNHYKLFAELAAKHGMEIHPESGGPHGAPVDALKCLGRSGVPMMEFWALSPHRPTDATRFFVKQAASAAHIYGKPLVAAEGFTSIGPQWEDTLWDKIKPVFDREICEGLNMTFWHTFTCSPKEMGLPGQEYFAGTHFNPQATWWEQSVAFVRYIDRCQFLMRQGLFVADVCYYYGDNVPCFVQLKPTDPAKILPGYDYDVVNEEVILTRMSVSNGRIVLPDGMSYRVMVLPERQSISVEALRKISELVQAGATVIGPKPAQAPGLQGYPECDAEVARLASSLWGDSDGTSVTEHAFGKGRVIWGKPARQVLAEGSVKPDFEFVATQKDAEMDYIHRVYQGAEIYFVCNRLNRPEQAQCIFRIEGRTPELWLADSGELRRCALYDTKDGRTALPLWLESFGSAFVIFRAPAAEHVISVSKDGKAVFPFGAQPEPAVAEIVISSKADGSFSLKAREAGAYECRDSKGRAAKAAIKDVAAPRAIEGAWTLRFPKGWGAPESAAFDRLKSWTECAEEGVKHFSGSATYSKEIEIPSEWIANGKSLELDLGQVKEFAEVRLNGKDLGILWKPPYSMNIKSAAKPGKNALEIRVTNLWPNRIIGDLALPEEKRLTHTNIVKFKKDSPLMPSGLLGPVRLIGADEVAVRF